MVSGRSVAVVVEACDNGIGKYEDLSSLSLLAVKALPCWSWCCAKKHDFTKKKRDSDTSDCDSGCLLSALAGSLSSNIYLSDHRDVPALLPGKCTSQN